jgi:hypothetical protein
MIRLVCLALLAALPAAAVAGRPNIILILAASHPDRVRKALARMEAECRPPDARR